MNRRQRRVASTLLVSLAFAGSCATTLGAQDRAGPAPTRPNGPWPIKTREHVDLWLHGYALVTEDTTTLPLFRRGYRDSLFVVRNMAHVSSRLDTARTSLMRALTALPRLVNGQFYPLHFTNFGTMRVSIQLLTQAKGDVKAVRDRDAAQFVALAANYFGTPQEREFAEELSVGLESESQRFFHTNWLEVQRSRGPVLARADSLWRTAWFPKLAGFLRGSGQRNGEIIVSHVVEGEGRTITADPTAGPSMVVTLPPSLDRTAEVLYGIVHESVGAFAAAAVIENITPKQRSTGVGDRLQTAAAIRAGMLLLQRALPSEVEGYARFYLRLLGKPIPAGVPSATTLELALPLSDDILGTMRTQLDLYLGGL